MPTAHIAIHATRAKRLGILAGILSEGPLPAGVLRATVNRRLREAGLPPIASRMLQNDLRWMGNQMGGSQIIRVSRSAITDPIPAVWKRYRWFYRLNGAEQVYPVPTGPCFLTDTEVIALQVAHGLLNSRTHPDRPTGTTVAPGPLAEAIASLVDRMGLRESWLRSSAIATVVQFAPQHYDAGSLMELIRAIRLGQSISMRYQAIDLSPETMHVQPVAIAFHETEPFCWCWDPSVTPSLRQYKVARASNIRRHPALPRVPTGLDMEIRMRRLRAFRGFVGSGTPQRVVIRFSALAAQQIEGRIYGTGQTAHRQPDGGVRLTFRTTGIGAVQRWVLRFGSEATIEAPAAAVAWVGKELRAAARRYSTAGRRPVLVRAQSR